MDDKFKFVIHACSPWKTQEKDDINVKKLLKSAYKNALYLAMKTKNIKSVAIPALGCGVNLIDPVTSARAALNAIIDIENETIGNDEQEEILLIMDFWLLDHDVYDAFSSEFACK